MTELQHRRHARRCCEKVKKNGAQIIANRSGKTLASEKVQAFFVMCKKMHIGSFTILTETGTNIAAMGYDDSGTVTDLLNKANKSILQIANSELFRQIQRV